LELINIKVFDNSIEAHLLKSRLVFEGIECYLFDEHLVSLDPLLNITVCGIKLKIKKSAKENAKIIISEIENSEITNENNEIIKCPQCNSTDFITGYKSMKGIKGVISAIVSFLYFVFPIYFKSVYRCKACGTEFNPN
jgi:uncharacterized Zn finger protein